MPLIVFVPCEPERGDQELNNDEGSAQTGTYRIPYLVSANRIEETALVITAGHNLASSQEVFAVTDAVQGVGFLPQRDQTCRDSSALLSELRAEAKAAKPGIVEVSDTHRKHLLTSSYANGANAASESELIQTFPLVSASSSLDAGILRVGGLRNTGIKVAKPSWTETAVTSPVQETSLVLSGVGVRDCYDAEQQRFLSRDGIPLHYEQASYPLSALATSQDHMLVVPEREPNDDDPRLPCNGDSGACTLQERRLQEEEQSAFDECIGMFLRRLPYGEDVNAGLEDMRFPYLVQRLDSPVVCPFFREAASELLGMGVANPFSELCPADLQPLPPR